MRQQINLYDISLQRQRDWLALANVAAAGVLLLAAVTAAGVLTRHEVPTLTAQTTTNDTAIKALQEQVTTLGQQVTGRKPDARLEQELGAAQLLLTAKGEVLTTLQQRMGPTAASFAEYLRGFGRQTVAGLWLTRFNFDAATGAMEIQGRTIDPALVPEYIRRLGKERAFQGRTFSALKLSEGKPDPAVAGATAPPVTTPVAATKKAPYHDFVLIPVKTDSKPAGGPG